MKDILTAILFVLGGFILLKLIIFSTNQMTISWQLKEREKLKKLKYFSFSDKPDNEGPVNVSFKYRDDYIKATIDYELYIMILLLQLTIQEKDFRCNLILEKIKEPHTFILNQFLILFNTIYLNRDVYISDYCVYNRGVEIEITDWCNKPELK